MNGGNIFNMKFQLPIGTFIYIWIALVVIVIVLMVVFTIPFAILTKLEASQTAFTILGALYTFMALYAPFDFIYGLGVDSVMGA